MMSAFKLPVVTLAALALSFTSYAATQKVELQFGDRHLQGENTIFLKQDLKDQFPGLKLNRLSLDKIRVVAKSKQGQGKAKLQVGNEETFIYQIGGDPGSFSSSLPASFDRVDINRPGYDSEGVWQLHLKGNIVLRKVVVFFEEESSFPTPTPGPGHQDGGWGHDDDSWGNDSSSLSFFSVDSVYVDRFETTEKITIRERDVKAIRLRSERGTIRVVEAVVTFAGGETKNLFELEGTIFEEDTKVIRFPRAKDVVGLTLRTISRSSGRLGKLDISVASR